MIQVLFCSSSQISSIEGSPPPPWRGGCYSRRRGGGWRRGGGFSFIWRGATLHSFLAKRFWYLHCVHHPSHPPSERFTCDLNYQWLHYKWSPAAAAFFWENFDERTAEQEAAYRVDQQAAKKAGKWKTRHVRLALPLHNLVQVADGTTPDNWQYEISEAAIQASVTFSTWMTKSFPSLTCCAPLPRVRPGLLLMPLRLLHRATNWPAS